MEFLSSPIPSKVKILNLEHEVVGHEVGEKVVILRITTLKGSADRDMVHYGGVIGFNIIDGIGNRKVLDDQVAYIASYGTEKIYGFLDLNGFLRIWRWDRKCPNDLFSLSRLITAIY